MEKLFSLLKEYYRSFGIDIDNTLEINQGRPGTSLPGRPFLSDG